LADLSAFSKELAEETRLLWVIGMTLAAILFGYPFEGYFDVLAASRPAWFPTFTTSCSTAHFLLFSFI
jgi:hypothetical protein